MTGTASAVTQEEARRQTEASMLLTGTIEIEADGSVRGYSIDREDKVPDYVRANIAQWVPTWRFKPVLVDDRAMPERAKMSLRMAAKPLGDGKFAIYIASAGFGGKSESEPTDSVTALEMKPPVFPQDVARMGGEGIVYILLKIGRQGTVEDVAVEQVNLTAYASNWKMQRIRLGLAEAAVKRAREWTFHTPSTGDLADEEFWSVRVPVDFSYAGDKKVAYGEWNAYLPGPRTHAPWLDESESAGNDALASGELQTIGTGPRLLTALRGG
jgi:hypothetical protein